MTQEIITHEQFCTKFIENVYQNIDSSESETTDSETTCHGSKENRATQR